MADFREEKEIIKGFVSEENIRLSKIMSVISVIGILFLVVSFFVYILGLVPSFVSPEEVSKHWGSGLREYIYKTHSPTGWDWIYLLLYGDMISFLSLAFLTLVAIISLMLLLPYYIKKRDNYLYIVIVEIIILVLAASGVVSG